MSIKKIKISVKNNLRIEQYEEEEKKNVQLILYAT